MALRILLADDSMTSQNMGKKILTEAGHEVTAVSNGAAAMKKLAEVKPDFAVLDIFMPGYNGLEVCAKIKSGSVIPAIPVLLTVGKMEPYKPEDSTKAGADGVIVKPFEATDLLAAIDKIVNKQAVAGPAARVPSKQAYANRFSGFKTSAGDTAEDTMRAETLEKDDTYSEWKSTTAEMEVPVEEPPPAESVEVPAEMAQTAAFMDMAVEPPSAEATIAASVTGVTMAMGAAAGAAAEAAMPAEMSPVAEAAPAYAEIPVPEASAAPAFAVENATATPPYSFEETVVAPPPMPSSYDETLLAPPVEAYEEVSAAAPEIVPTAAAPEVETEVARDPGLETTAAEAVQVAPPARDPAFEPTVLETPVEISSAPAVDPALVTDTTELSSFTTKFGVEGAEPISVGMASDVHGLYADEAPAAETAPAELAPEIAAAPVVEFAEAPAAEAPPEPHADLEAQLATAIEKYESALDLPPVPPPPAPEVVAEPVREQADLVIPDPEAAAKELESIVESAAQPAEPEPAVTPELEQALVQQMQEAVADMPPAEPHVEPEPVPVEAAAPAPPPVPTVQAPAPAGEPDLVLAAAMAAAVGGAPPSGVTGAMKELSADDVALAVHNVFERFKPDLIAEIARELKKK